MFRITNNDVFNVEQDTIGYKQFAFPGGEVGFQFDGPNYNFFGKGPYKINAKLQRSDDVMALAMLVDAINQRDPGAKINLVCPYVPYARQDRVCNWGEAHSLKVFGRFINSLNFNTVTVVDPHSDVTAGVIDRIKIIPQLDVARTFKPFYDRVMESNCVFVSPDAGANKKTSNLAAYFNHREFVRGDKLRDLATGNIKETVVYCDDLQGTDVIIADDICDGGMTFIKLAEALRKKNCGKVVLFVTHGIFSKGFNNLFHNGIDEIYTTNSFDIYHLGDMPKAPKLNILDLSYL